MRLPHSIKSARLLTLVGLALSATHAAAQCPWSSQFASAASGLTGGNGYPAAAYCMQVFDPDGPGPLPDELYVGGYFITAGGNSALRIAKWNGTSWSIVGGGMSGTNAEVRALGLHDPDGPGPALPVLVAAGTFTSAGGVAVSNIASWDGHQWSPLGSPQLQYFPCGIADFDPDGSGPLPAKLVLAGGFEHPSGAYFTAISMWDGQSWTVAPEGGPGGARAMAIFDQDGAGPENDSIFIGTTDSPGIWRFDGTTWNVVGGGLTRSLPYICNTLRVVDEDGPGPGRPALLVGGSFSAAGGIGAFGIARWNGAAWSAMGPGLADVNDILAIDRPGLPPTIYAVTLYNVNRWNTSAWTNVGTLDGTSIFAVSMRLAAYSGPDATPSLYLGGYANTIDAIPLWGIARTQCTCYANCDASAASPLLTANDFQCFLNRFAQQNAYANCDGSTNLPTLTANDFQCYLNAYAAGCS